MEEVGNFDNGSSCVAGGESYEILPKNAFITIVEVKWGSRTSTVAMHAIPRSNSLVDYKNTKEEDIRITIIHAKEPTAIAFSRPTQTLISTRRKPMLANLGLLVQGAKLLTSSKMVVKGLKVRLQVAGGIWDTAGGEFVLTFGVAYWSTSTAFTHVAAKIGLQFVVVLSFTGIDETPLHWDLYAPKGLNSARKFFTCLNFEYQGTAHALELASCGLDVPRLNIPDMMQDHSANYCINPVKGALVYSNIVTRVSPTYAQEVQTSQVGCITRLVPHKGLHLIRHAIYRMLELGGQLVLLVSSPVPQIQGEFEELVNHFKGHPNVCLILKYYEVLSNSINAASDIFIMRSIFEPYGLTEMIACSSKPQKFLSSD